MAAAAVVGFDVGATVAAAAAAAAVTVAEATATLTAAARGSVSAENTFSAG